MLKFWQYDDFNRAYTYKTTDLASLLYLKNYGQVSRFVRQSSSVVLRNTDSICPVCKTRYKAFNRQKLSKLPVNPKTCNSCETMIQNEFITAKIEYLSDKLNALNFDSIENFEEINLNYFELISLYVLIRPSSKKRAIFYKKNKLHLTFSCDLDNRILKGLIEKRIIFELQKQDYDELIVNDYHGDATDFALFNFGSLWGLKHANKNLRNTLQKLFQTKLPKYGVHILLPKNFKSFLTFKLNIQQKLESYILSLNDIEHIESVVLQQRLDLAHKMVRGSGKFFKLKIEHSVKLELLLTNLVKKHPIEEVNYMIFKIASDSKHYLEFENSDFNKYAKKYLFTKALERKIKYLEDIEFTLYKQKLPDFMKNTKLEEFFNSNIVRKNYDEEGSWQDLSVNEIIALWLNSFDEAVFEKL